MILYLTFNIVLIHNYLLDDRKLFIFYKEYIFVIYELSIAIYNLHAIPISFSIPRPTVVIKPL